VTSSATERGVRRVLIVTLLLNLLVSAGKLVVGWLSSSLSMQADGYHSLVDGANNVIGLIVVAFAYRPPDDGHPYGHRKFETAATLVIGAALLTLAYQVLEGAFTQASLGRLPVIGLLNWTVMGATIAMNLFVSWYEAREGRLLGSEYLVADATHTRADLYVSLGVMASFAGARAGLVWADVAVAMAIAGVIGVQAVRILVGSFHVLTDRAQIGALELQSLVEGVPGVQRCTAVRTRGQADAVYVDLTVKVDGNSSLRAAHEVADRIEATLQAARPQIVDVIVHLEPWP
jgi:cation diffusion facilitator family transporter